MPDIRVCPACAKMFGPEYADTFCVCGVELVKGHAATTSPPAAPPEASLSVPVAVVKPPAGTCCLVLYGPDGQPLHYFPLEKDATLIGRLDAVAGIFPDIDLGEWLDPAMARKISRKHALILRSRATRAYVLRPLAANTGTQVESDMVPALQDVPLANGRRIVLGGAVRLKFEMV